jgi:hypothetical protein
MPVYLYDPEVLTLRLNAGTPAVHAGVVFKNRGALTDSVDLVGIVTEHGKLGAEAVRCLHGHPVVLRGACAWRMCQDSSPPLDKSASGSGDPP